MTGREVRVLHSLSFIDDPTRAIRAVRYARRLDFEIAQDTEHLIKTAVAEGVFERLSGQRLRRELEQLLAEPHPTPSLAMLADLGLLEAICPDLDWTDGQYDFLLEVEGQLSWFLLERLGEPPPPLLLFFGALAVSAGPGAPARLAERLSLTGAAGRRLVDLGADIERLRNLAADSAPMSQRVAAVEQAQAEGVLLAMAASDLERRRCLAEAAVAAARYPAPISGRELVEAGVPEGPHVGRAIAAARAAVLDERVDAAGVLDFAVAEALRLNEAT